MQISKWAYRLFMVLLIVAQYVRRHTPVVERDASTEFQNVCVCV